MIGTDEMSSTGMDISESFRPEDISKTDFFDFVTAPDMGIGLGVNVNLHHSHHSHQHHHHHHHTQHHTQQQQPQPALSMTQQQQQQHHHNNNNNNNTHPHHGSQHQHQHSTTTDRTMTHDGGGGGGGNGGNVSIGTSGDSHNDASGLSDGSSASTTDPTLHGYEFWSTTDKEHTSTIFEDLDRYCWQQQSNTTASTNNSSATVMHHSTPANTLNPLHTSTVNPTSPHNHHSPAPSVTTPTSLTSTPVPQTQLNSDGTISNIISTDGQIYTLTVLNGNEPWLKRDSDAHLNSALDLDSLLGTFPGYIKSEYPYDDSGFSTDGCKDVNSEASNVMNSSSSGGGGGGVIANNQRLPSLLNTISVTSSGAGGGVGGNVSNASDSVSTALSIGQQLDQFHNNNNDWHMTDHNNEQNSAESLLRSALQGKGYSKGLHMHNGITLMSTSPTVKDEDMRRILFPVDTDGLNFSDTSLTAAQIFDDTQSANGHNPHMVVPHSPVTNGPLTPVTNNPNNNNNNSSNPAASLIVDDMFLTLENAFSDDFEKIKQFCTAGSNTNDYGANEVMMQISPNVNGTTASTATNPGSIPAVTTCNQPMLTSLHGAAITSTPNNACRLSTPVGGMAAATIPTQQQQHQQQQQQQPPPQPLKPEVTTSTQRIVSTAKVTKKYKRTLTTAHHNNNNNPNVINHNNNNNTTTTNKGSSNTMTLTNGQNRNGNNSSSGSSTNSSNSPTHCNGMMAAGVGGGVIGGNTATTNSANTSSTTSSSSSSSSSAPGQRKERSLHYCSICSKGFKDKYSVNVHIRTHTGEKPFACTLCGKSFRQKAHLAKHYQTHMAQKNNGNLVKGSSSKHHRSSNAQNLNTSAMAAHNHPRSLSLATTPITPSSMAGSNVGGLVSGILSSSGLPPLGVPVSASSAPTTPTTILPPANGLLANR
ncbi:ichor [Calliphora vicina]|uniref:ichor n=1 Tax=Calliphora vicina TaxID=7373 RepID=UPI00325B6D92